MSARRLATVLLAGSLIACAAPAPGPPIYQVEFNRSDEGGMVAVLPELDEPFSVHETVSLRTGFSWATTHDVRQTDASGRPALYSAIAYISTDDQRNLLDAVGPHAPLPLFEEERARWSGQVGRFAHFGDGAGLFHFVVLTGTAYNALRGLALDGHPAIDALILRDAPASGASDGSGGLSYDWLAERGFRMSPEPEPTTAGPHAEPFIIELIVLLLASRDARDAADDALGSAARIGAEGHMTVSLVPLGTDPDFNGMQRAWGQPSPLHVRDGVGFPLVLRDVEVVAQLPAGISRGRTDASGTARVSVRNGATIHFCVRANNFAVQVDEGFEAIELCDFRVGGALPPIIARDGAGAFVVVGDPVFNIVLQMTDANEYAFRVAGHSVSHRAAVLVGPFADVFGAINGGRAFTVCGGYTSLLNAGWFNVAQSVTLLSGLADVFAANPFLTPDTLIGLPFLVAKVMAHDIMFPDYAFPPNALITTAAWSRTVPTHEYGHFLMCDLLSTLGGDGDFTEAWGDVILTILTLTPPPGPERENLWVVEGFADYFASQVAGGVNYFDLSSGSGARRGNVFYCDPAMSTCLEDNIGGLAAIASNNTINRNNSNSNPLFQQRIARTTTIMQDLVDGPPRMLWDGAREQPSVGAEWVIPAGMTTFAPVTGIIATDAMDESVFLAGSFITTTVRNMSTRGNTLNAHNFYGALARVAREHATENQVCALFALHSPDGMCTGIVPLDALHDGPVPPSMPTIIDGHVDHGNGGHWTWSDMSFFASGYTFQILRDGDAVLVDTMSAPYLRSQTHNEIALPFDDAITFRVATVSSDAGETLTSGFAQHTLHTFAQSVGLVSATPLRGAATLSWSHVTATQFVIIDVTGGGSVEVARTSDRLITLGGLPGGVERTYQVISVNAVGVRSDPSPNVNVTPLLPNQVFVAPFGNDSSPTAGTPATPFQTLHAALARAAATGADEVLLHDGNYSETAFTISMAITIRGGMHASGGVWSDAGGVSTVTVTGGSLVPSCVAGPFNAAGAPVAAAVFVDETVDVRIENVDFASSRGSLPAATCFAALAVDQGSLTLVDCDVRALGAATGACGTGVFVRGASFAAIGSSIRGMATAATSVPAGLDLTGVASCADAVLSFERASVFGLDAPLMTSPGSVRSLSATMGAADSMTSSRSLFEPLAGRYAWDASDGIIEGIDIQATRRVFLHDSIVRTTHGGLHNRAIRIGGVGVGALASVSLYHVTAIIGDDWGSVHAVPPLATSAVISFVGDIRDIAMFNNMLSYAGGSSDGVTLNGVDRSASTTDPATFTFEGNIISIPYTNPSVVAALASCGEGREFGQSYSEDTLNTPGALRCHGSGTSSASWTFRRNAAFTDFPVFPPPLIPDPLAVVEFTANAVVTEPARVFIVGEVIAETPLFLDVITDFGGNARGNPPGVGAWAE